jgi:AcrR family transcriptional regulator
VDSVLDIGRRERRRLAIRQGLLDAASELFGEQGITHTTVDDIAQAADVARQTVFNHFPYKEAIVLELVANKVSVVAAEAHVLLETGTAALEALTCVGERVLEIALEDPERSSIVARELLNPDAERAARAAEHIPLCHLIEAILVQAREEGSVRGELALDVVAKRLSAALASLVAEASTRGADVLRRDLNILFDIWLHGITERSL